MPLGRVLGCLLLIGVSVPCGAPAAPPHSPQPPQLLPSVHARGLSATRWVVGARATATSRQLAGVYGAARAGVAGSYVVSASRASAFAAALRHRHLLLWSEPDSGRRLAQAQVRDPLSFDGDWRTAVVPDGLTPPPVGPASPQLALLDAQADPTHPEWQGSNATFAAGDPVTETHGTATMSVAAAPQNGIGMIGLWPGMRAINVHTRLTCSGSAAAIAYAIQLKVSVINMSYGAPAFCYDEYLALEYAFGDGIVPVAAAGNEFAEGNPIEFPASLPHVLTAAAIGPDGQATEFSNDNNAIDLSAPGVNITAAVPTALDDDGNPDGYQKLAGTSFAAPIIAAAAAWLRAARPNLDGYQTEQALRESATDLSSRGWDSATGWGLVDVGSALSTPRPAADYGEPNDDIGWVNGTYYQRADPPVTRGGYVKLHGLLDKWEDNSDVFPVSFPPRSTLRFRLRTSFGDADLAGFSSRAKDTSAHALNRSHRTGHLDAFLLTNSCRCRAKAYVQAYIDDRARSLSAFYTLAINRVAYHRPRRRR
jgi:hypothetical protein